LELRPNDDLATKVVRKAAMRCFEEDDEEEDEKEGEKNDGVKEDAYGKEEEDEEERKLRRRWSQIRGMT